MIDGRGPAMDQRRRVNDSAAERMPDRLMAETHTEDWDPGAQGTDSVNANTCGFGPARAGRYDNPGWTEPPNLVHGELIVSPNDNLPRQLANKLHQIECERVVVVNNKDHRQPVIRFDK